MENAISKREILKHSHATRYFIIGICVMVVTFGIIIANIINMIMQIIDLNKEQVEDIEERLDQYDEKHITYSLDGRISIGIEADGNLVAGLDACMTAFKILMSLQCLSMRNTEDMDMAVS